MPNDQFTHSVWNHLEELRSRVVKSVLGIIVGAVIFYRFVDPLMYAIVKPVGRLVFTSPSEAFVARMLLTILGGIVVASPIIGYQVWSFIALGLKEREKKYILIFGPLSLFFFILGISFAYFVALPMSLYFFMGFSSEWLVPMITVNNYISFFTSLILAFGILFELPLILIFLTAIGIATPEFLIQKRKVAIMIILIISAIVTPPDVISMIIMTVPMVILYECGVLASKITFHQKFSKA